MPALFGLWNQLLDKGVVIDAHVSVPFVYVSIYKMTYCKSGLLLTLFVLVISYSSYDQPLLRDTTWKLACSTNSPIG